MNIDVFKLLLDGTVITLRMFALTIIFSIPLGLLVSVLRMSKLWIFNLPARLYILVLRGTPLMLQIMFIFYAPGLIHGFPFSWQGDRMLAANVALILNYAAYLAEIFRGGIQAIPQGQREAGKVLGLTKIQTFFIVILPQVVKQVIPPMGNEIINLVKDTSLVQVIGITELMNTAKVQASGNVSILPYLVAGGIYLGITIILSAVLSFTEKKLDYYR